ISPMAVPSATTRFFICSEASILSRRARSMLRILPRKGKTACTRRSRPILAVPPAESPSTMKSSPSSARVVRVLLEERGEGFAEDALGRAARLHAAKLRFGLAFELHLAHLHRDDRRDAFENVVAREAVAFFAVPVAVAVAARQVRFEACDVHTAFGVVNIVGECRDASRDVVHVLERDLYRNAVLFFLHIENIFVDRLLVAGLERDQAAEPAFEIE